MLKLLNVSTLPRVIISKNVTARGPISDNTSQRSDRTKCILVRGEFSQPHPYQFSSTPFFSIEWSWLYSFAIKTLGLLDCPPHIRYEICYNTKLLIKNTLIKSSLFAVTFAWNIMWAMWFFPLSNSNLEYGRELIQTTKRWLVYELFLPSNCVANVILLDKMSKDQNQWG